MTAATGRDRLPPRPRWASDVLGWSLLALVAWVPPLLTAPGRVGADTKQYLYLDPARLLGRAASMWDPNVGMGTVTHQNIGYLFPMGPYYWLCDAIGLPDWFAQRIWLGAIVFAAGAGVLYLFRTLELRGPGAVVGALAYMFNPYSLDYAARISVILLPWAALGFLLGLTIRALRDGGWYHAAAFALVVQVVGGVNATALVFAGLAPVLWLVYAVTVAREADWRRGLATAARIGGLTAVTSAWWVAGLSIQSGYGIDILRYTETVQAVARTSAPNEVLRGLGYWFFYGQDLIGPWIEAAVNYTQSPGTILLGYGIAALALLSAGLVRWRHRAYFVGLVVVGTVVSVGAHPYDDPTPLGAAFRGFAESSTVGLALRSTGRATPLVVLGLAVLLATGVDALVRAAHRRGLGVVGLGAAGVVVLLVLANFPALWDGTYYGTNLQRPEDLPTAWTDATDALEEGATDTRVLELPGADFASYRWGNTVDPITPGLTDRPYVARELIPYGTPPAADLLNAFDRRFQEGLVDPAAVVPVLRRMGVGDVVARNDLQWERYDLVTPSSVALALAGVAGLGEPRTFGAVGSADAPDLRPREPDFARPPVEVAPVEVRGVDDPWPIVRSAPGRGAVVLAGSGEGLLDAAAVGLLDDDRVTLYSASFAGAPEALDEVLARDPTLVVTDTNRERGVRWSTVARNLGATEPAGTEVPPISPGDARLDVFPDTERGDGTRTVVEYRGIAAVHASEYGNPITFTPEDRAFLAIDGDPDTAWVVGAFDAVVGQSWTVRFEGPVTTDRVELVQSLRSANRHVTEVELRFDGGDPIRASLGLASRTPAGELVEFPRRTFTELEVEITAESSPPGRLEYADADPVGFAEVRVRDEGAADPVVAEELVVLPIDLVDAVRGGSDDRPLVYVLTRSRQLELPTRGDEERALHRVFDVPDRRAFGLTGSARLRSRVSGTRAREPVGLDAVLGVPPPGEGGVRVSQREFLPGCPRCRASSAIDGDPATAWRTPFVGVDYQWAEYELAEPVTFDRLDLAVVADGRHSRPTRLRLVVDGDVQYVDLPTVADVPGVARDATVSVPVRLARPMSGRVVRIQIVGVDEERRADHFSERELAMPVGIAEWGIPGLRLPPPPDDLPGACRTDLLELDGAALPVRVVGSRADAESLAPLEVAMCDPDDPGAVPELVLDAGRHELRAAPGAHTGLHLDRLVLASAAGGGAAPVGDGRVGPIGVPPPPSPEVTVTADGRTTMELDVTGVDEPFWLVLGQSVSPGWQARVDGEGLGPPTLVDGFANGWFVEPDGRSRVSVRLEWVPQRRVWIALGLSVLAAIGCAVVVAVGWRARRWRGRPPSTGGDDGSGGPDGRPAVRPRVGVVVAGALATGTVAGVVAGPVVGAVTGLATAVALVWAPARVALGVAPALLVGLVGAYVAYRQWRDALPPVFEWPTFTPRARQPAWLAVTLLGASAVVEVLRRPPSTPRAASGEEDPGPASDIVRE